MNRKGLKNIHGHDNLCLIQLPSDWYEVIFLVSCSSVLCVMGCAFALIYNPAPSPLTLTLTSLSPRIIKTTKSTTFGKGTDRSHLKIRIGRFCKNQAICFKSVSVLRVKLADLTLREQTAGAQLADASVVLLQCLTWRLNLPYSPTASTPNTSQRKQTTQGTASQLLILLLRLNKWDAH